jgi:hypothetical protein
VFRRLLTQHSGRISDWFARRESVSTSTLLDIEVHTHVAIATTATPINEAMRTRAPSCSRIGMRILSMASGPLLWPAPAPPDVSMMPSTQEDWATASGRLQYGFVAPTQDAVAHSSLIVQPERKEEAERVNASSSSTRQAIREGEVVARVGRSTLGSGICG